MPCRRGLVVRWKSRYQVPGPMRAAVFLFHVARLGDVEVAIGELLDDVEPELLSRSGTR